MAITLYRPGLEIRVGQFVNMATILRIGFASRPARVAEVKRASVVVEDARRSRDGDGAIEFDAPRTKRMTSVTFVCDTFDEAESVSLASARFSHEMFEREREYTTETARLKAEALRAVLSANADVSPTDSG